MKSSSIGLAVSTSILILISANCSSSSSSSNGSTAGGGDSGSSSCNSPAGNTGDGSSACGSATCAPGQYCQDSTVSSCENGCTAIDNCAQGSYCDLSNPTTDPFNKSVGTCRVPPSCTTTQDSSTSATCPDVHGVYSVTLDTSGSSQACTSAFSNTTCTITETSCALAWSCSPNNGFTNSTVDSSGDSTVTLPAPGGGSATCALVFTSGAFTFDCQFTAQGTAVDCKGNATEN